MNPKQSMKRKLANTKFDKLVAEAKVKKLEAQLAKQSEILAILKKHAKKVSEVPGQEKEPDIQITVMPEADEEYETIMKWLEEEE